MERLHFLRNQIIQTSKFSLEVFDSVAILYINSPGDLNRITKQFKEEFVSSLKLINENDNIKVVVLLSKVDKVFSTGGDLKELGSGSVTYENQLSKDIFQEFIFALQNFKKPLIMGVHGMAFGAAFEMFLYGDIILVAENTTLRFTELQYGISTAIGGSQTSTQLIGRINAMRYILTTDTVPLLEAKKMGLVNEIVKKDQLKDECLKIASKIAERPLEELILMKYIIKSMEEQGSNQSQKNAMFLISSLRNVQK